MKRMSFNYNKLKGRIKEICQTQEKFAKELNISEPALIKKLNNQSQFTQTEILKSREILNISDTEVDKYFFSKQS